MKALLSKTEPRIVTPENKQDGVFSWDSDNQYVTRIKDLTADSVTATSCLRIYTKFVIGGGCTDQDFYKAVINRKGLRVDGLLRKIAKDGKCLVDSFAIHVNYNAAYEVVEATPIRMLDFRISIDGEKAAIHPDWAKKIKSGKGKFNKSDVKFYNWFNPDPVAIEAQVAEAGGWDNYEGQVYFWSPEGIGYSVAVYDPCAEDMKTEGRLKLFRFRSADQNFLASHVVIVNASESREDDFLDEEGKPLPPNRKPEATHGDVVQSALTQFQGADNTASTILIEKENPEDTFEIEKLDLQSYDGMYKETETSCKEAILESFLVPKALLLRSSSSLGTSQEIELAKAFYNDVTADDRLVIEEAFQEIFSRWEYPICPSGDYSIIAIPTKGFAGIFGKLGEKAATMAMEVLNSTKTKPQKLATLIYVVGVDEADANLLIDSFE